jgi:hypothetical protein
MIAGVTPPRPTILPKLANDRVVGDVEIQTEDRLARRTELRLDQGRRTASGVRVRVAARRADGIGR